MSVARLTEADWVAAPEFGRRPSILHALRMLDAWRAGPPCIVETGTLREDNPHGCSGDGWSTVAWAWYCSLTGGRVWTVDISDGAMEACRRRTAEYAASVEYVVEDSIEFLRRWASADRAPVDLVYLDSLDYFDRERSEAHCLAEAELTRSILGSPGLVLIDDTSLAGGVDADGRPALTGKGTRAVPYLLSQGFRLESLEGGQALLSKDAKTD